MQTVILAAGLGTRLGPLTKNISKPMLPVANKPFIEWIVQAAGKDLIVVARKDQSDLINYMDGKAEIVYQEKPLGTGDALLSCKGHLKGDFLVVNGDCLFSKEDVKKFRPYSVGGFPVSNVEMFGEVMSNDGFASDIKEKSEKGNGMANAGIYALDEEIFRLLGRTGRSKRGEYEVTDALRTLMKEHKMKVVQLREWNTITYPWDILDMNSHILEKEGSQISDEAEIRSGSYIEEPVAIGKSVIGPNCCIRKSSSIGNNCRVGNAVEIKNSIVMDGTHVSHLSYVGDSIVGRNVNIGAGTIFANLRLDEKSVGMNIRGKNINSGRKKLGAVVGDNAKLGVNVTIMPGKKIWSDIMIPSNAIIARDVEKQPSMKNIGKVI